MHVPKRGIAKILDEQARNGATKEIRDKAKKKLEEVMFANDGDTIIIGGEEYEIRIS